MTDHKKHVAADIGHWIGNLAVAADFAEMDIVPCAATIDSFKQAADELNTFGDFLIEQGVTQKINAAWQEYRQAKMEDSENAVNE